MDKGSKSKPIIVRAVEVPRVPDYFAPNAYPFSAENVRIRPEDLPERLPCGHLRAFVIDGRPAEAVCVVCDRRSLELAADDVLAAAGHRMGMDSWFSAAEANAARRLVAERDARERAAALKGIRKYLGLLPDDDVVPGAVGPTWLSEDEVAVAVGVCSRTWRRWVADKTKGTPEAHRIGGRALWLANEVASYIAAMERK